MIRPALTEIGIFLIPFAVYALFLIATRSGAAGASRPGRCMSSPSWRSARCCWSIVSFVLLAHFSGASPNSTYIPAHIENGKFVPGVEK